MNEVLLRVLYVIKGLINIVQLLIIARAIMSWVIMFLRRGNVIYDFLCMMTDPFIMPVRRLIEKMGFGRNSMVDFSPLATLLILSLLMRLL